MLIKFKTYLRLGIFNLYRVVAYRLSLKSGVLTRNMSVGRPIKGLFFQPCFLNPGFTGEYQLCDELLSFGWLKVPVDKVPSWHTSLLSNKQHPFYQRHWSTIPDFVQGVGDIKAIWELSRFDWVVIFATNYVKSRDVVWLVKLNEWLEDWSANNPVNVGPNWKCGQEASIRILHLTVAAYLLSQLEAPLKSLQLMLIQHLERIAPTISYAVGQDNNHGTSEAAALFIGGSWLTSISDSKNAKKWRNVGRYWLENRVTYLIENDGSFSQYSVNYHRLMLDTISLAELGRRWFSQPKFNESFYKKMQGATSWLNSMTIPENGHAPNLGANDGARLIPLSNTDYRDFRPSVQLASAVFFCKRAYEKGGLYDEPCKLLGVAKNRQVLPALQSRVFDNGGYAAIRNGSSRLFLRYPKFRFRPSQCDALHIDLWIKSKNLLRDGGTYSYNSDEKWLNYFPGVASHNTIQFDNREQMPRLSRFLFGEWLSVAAVGKVIGEDGGDQDFEVSYKDWQGASHLRKIKLLQSSLFVTDVVSGFRERAILRWRLIPGNWLLNNNEAILGDISLTIESSDVIKRIDLVEGWESRYYLQKAILPVLEIEVERDSILTTKVAW